MRLMQPILMVIFCLFFVTLAQAGNAKSALTESQYPPDIAAIKESGVLRVAMVSAGVPPFFMQDAQGNWTGIDVDFDRLTAQALGVKLVIVSIPTYDGVIDAVANGQADLGGGLLSVTPDRALRVKFSDGTYAYHPSLLVNRMQMNRLGWNIVNVVSHLQLTNQPLKIGALQYSANIALLQGAAPAAEIITFPTEDAALEAVAKGDVFAAMSDTPEQMNNWLNAHPRAALTTVQGVLTSRSVLFGVAMSWKSENLREWMNVFIKNLESLHMRETLFEKYQVEDPGA
ncbi:MAG: ABC transporter substrate-binding protein [Gammaproteobacteria bacterium]|nr:ABC transporter substrate-binding protein [Gammaproteobacteria bacterium]